MSIPVRKVIRILLINDQNQLLLMCIEDFDISALGGKKNKRFWCTIGGGIENGESLKQAALREIHEETGIDQSEIDLGPVVWYSELDLLFKGNPTRFAESYIVARTKQTNVFLHKPTQDEQKFVKKLQWFSFQDIKNSTEVIFPARLAEYLPDILARKYPKQPILIDNPK